MRFSQLIFRFKIDFTNTRLNIDQQKGFPTGSPALIPKLVAPQPQNYTEMLCVTGYAIQPKVTGHTSPRPEPLAGVARNGTPATQHLD